MPTFIPAHGRTPHLAGVCVNRIGTVRAMGNDPIAQRPAVAMVRFRWRVIDRPVQPDICVQEIFRRQIYRTRFGISSSLVDLDAYNDLRRAKQFFTGTLGSYV